MTNVANRLLLIDDEPAICDFIRKVAVSVGFDVEATSSPDEFRESLREFEPNTVLMDLNMPEVDGIELLGILGDERYPGAVLIVSAADSRVLAAAEKSGNAHGLRMLGSLQKPVSLSELRDALKDVCVAQHVTTEEELRQALDLGELVLHFQPKMVRREDDEWLMDGAEALVRWEHPKYGLLMPSEFLPMMEHTGLILELTDYVLRAAVAQIEVWQKRGIEIPVAVNIPADLLIDPGFPDRLFALLKEYGVHSSNLGLEITETGVTEAPELSIDMLARLRLKGIELAIDDFGTGYSSMTRLHHLPFSELKLDRSFIMEIHKDGEAKTMVQAMISLAHNLNMTACAEGVESQEILDFLYSQDCDKVQGYFFSKPINTTALEKFVLKWGHSTPQNSSLLCTS